jgi:hypothetical protein
MLTDSVEWRVFNASMLRFAKLACAFFCALHLACFTGMAVPETNLWPFWVEREATEDSTEWLSAGPIIGSKHGLTGSDVFSIRPLWTRFDTPDETRAHILYPLANWTQREGVGFGHILNLVRYRKNTVRGAERFEAFPLLFYSDGPEPDERYAALFPVGGVLKNRLFRDRIEFVLWPLYVRTHRGDEVRVHLPYPFVQTLRGPKSKGFGLWPLYGHFQRENDYTNRWALWPFFYDYQTQLYKSEPYRRFGLWPFYHRETAVGMKSESVVWPFFGYTRESSPRDAYWEHRYFWPFLVQAKGEADIRINRWLPLYSYERRGPEESEWYLWPLLKRERWDLGPLQRKRDTLLYFLYRDERQVMPQGTARLTTLWPLLGYWNDGEEREQLQVLDPFTVFFPRNQAVKENWSPLFALYRLDREGLDSRHSLLWDLLVLERHDGKLSGFQLGPLFRWESEAGGTEWSLLSGLVKRVRGTEERTTTYFWRSD